MCRQVIDHQLIVIQQEPLQLQFWVSARGALNSGSIYSERALDSAPFTLSVRWIRLHLLSHLPNFDVCSITLCCAADIQYKRTDLTIEQWRWYTRYTDSHYSRAVTLVYRIY